MVLAVIGHDTHYLKNCESCRLFGGATWCSLKQMCVTNALCCCAHNGHVAFGKLANIHACLLETRSNNIKSSAMSLPLHHYRCPVLQCAYKHNTQRGCIQSCHAQLLSIITCCKPAYAYTWTYPHSIQCICSHATHSKMHGKLNTNTWWNSLSSTCSQMCDCVSPAVCVCNNSTCVVLNMLYMHARAHPQQQCARKHAVHNKLHGELMIRRWANLLQRICKGHASTRVQLCVCRCVCICSACGMPCLCERHPCCTYYEILTCVCRSMLCAHDSHLVF